MLSFYTDCLLHFKNRPHDKLLVFVVAGGIKEQSFACLSAEAQSEIGGWVSFQNYWLKTNSSTHQEIQNKIYTENNPADATPEERRITSTAWTFGRVDQADDGSEHRRATIHLEISAEHGAIGPGDRFIKKLGLWHFEQNHVLKRIGKKMGHR